MDLDERGLAEARQGATRGHERALERDGQGATERDVGELVARSRRSSSCVDHEKKFRWMLDEFPDSSASESDLPGFFSPQSDSLRVDELAAEAGHSTDRLKRQQTRIA